MASSLQSTACASRAPPFKPIHSLVRLSPFQLSISTAPGRKYRIRASNGGSNDSYLDMWKNAVDRKQKELEFGKILENSASSDDGGGRYEESPEDLERKSNEFKKILEVPKEERDRVQRIQVIDRAAAAIAAARAIIKDNRSTINDYFDDPTNSSSRNLADQNDDGGTQSRSPHDKQPRTSVLGTPGPDFWSWTPPLGDDPSLYDASISRKSSLASAEPNPVISVMEKDRSADSLSLPFESNVSLNKRYPLVPPLQSLAEVDEEEASDTGVDKNISYEELGHQFSGHAAEAAHALDEMEEKSSTGISPDGSRWWKETGVEQRPDGVVCHWTLIRGVSADGVVEWENKYWEAANKIGHKELGSEKSGRDARGNVWREYWKESMWQDRGLLHMAKTADKWGKNGEGTEWREQWNEFYDASGRADKWADKWCSIDPSTQLNVGHAHVWHERWGEQYDGRGGSIKYTDKWAERCEVDGWSKWGDKWDENFDLNGHGVKQGETWWEGKYGERWNRTWGEQHNGSGWVHKYGKSSSGEHWDTHVQEDTWYERYPHYGFAHCLENSVQLREVKSRPEAS